MAKENAGGDTALIDTFARVFAFQLVVYSPLVLTQAAVATSSP